MRSPLEKLTKNSTWLTFLLITCPRAVSCAFLSGTVFSPLFPMPDKYKDKYLCWVMVVGSILSMLGLFMFRLVSARIKTFKSIREVYDRIPKTKEDADRLDITNPIEFCVYMASMDFCFTFYHAYRKDAQLKASPAVLQAGPKDCKLFMELYHRLPGNDAAETGSWGFCAAAEAAIEKGVPIEEVNTETVNSLVSPQFRNRLDFVVQREGTE